LSVGEIVLATTVITDGDDTCKYLPDPDDPENYDGEADENCWIYHPPQPQEGSAETAAGQILRRDMANQH
jgi:hypothetical protein